MSKKKKGNKDKQEMNVSREGNIYTVSESNNDFRVTSGEIDLNGIKIAEKADIEDLHAEISELRSQLTTAEVEIDDFRIELLEEKGRNNALEAVIDALVEDVAELNK